MNNGPHEGLFAFKDDQFYHHFQAQPDLDHIEWFGRIGLPNHGPAYDAMLRGKVNYDLDTDRIIVGFYGTAYLSNARYRRIVGTFALDEEKVVEKMLTEAY